MESLFTLRLRKLWFAAIHPGCWRGARRGVFPSVEHRGVLRLLQPDAILDIGANRGQFALLMRELHPAVPVASFEPLRGEARIFRDVFAGDPAVTLHEHALGEEAGSAVIHVSGRADSSSLLPIGDLQSRLYPATAEVGQSEIPVRRLDDLPEVWRPYRHILCKLDVQGFELPVLRGAAEALRHCEWVYAECSEVPLYVGQALAPEVHAFLESHGFRRIARCNPTVAEGRLVQADDLFQRVDGFRNRLS